MDHIYTATPMKIALANVSSTVRSKVDDMASSEVVAHLESSLGGMPSCWPARRLTAPKVPSKEACDQHN